MNILITGAHGQVGRELTDQGRCEGLRVWPTDVDDLDITDQPQVAAFIKQHRIDLVANAAAYTAVDRAETESDLCWRINRDGPATLAQICAAAEIPLVHISTDYVYNGHNTSPYHEDDPVAPTGVYGASKASGDQEIQHHLVQHIILRTAWLYSVHGHNFVKTMLRLARERETLAVIDDQIGCPTSAADLAKAILEIVNQIESRRTTAWGIYHYSGGGQTTWYGFAQTIFELAAPYERFTLRNLRPITSAEYPTAATRPHYSVLDCSKIKQHFDISPVPWQTSLERTIAQLYGAKKLL